MNDNNFRSFNQLISSIRDDKNVSIPLLYHLSDLSPDNFKQFCDSWKEFDDERKRIVIQHLADISEENFQVDFTDIFAFCLTDESVPVRRASLEGLWDSDRLSLIAPLIDVMRSDEDSEVRAMAAATLGHFILLSEWGQIPAGKSEPIEEALLSELEDFNTPLNIRRAALESISGSPHPRVPRFIEEAYGSESHDLRVSAIFAMGRSADANWLPDILEEMSNPRLEMRIEAAAAAGAIGHSSAVQKLAELLIDDELEVKLAAISSLGKIGGSRAQNLLETLADDPEFGELQSAATEALEEISWLGGEIDLSFMDWENNGDAEPFLSA